MTAPVLVVAGDVRPSRLDLRVVGDATGTRVTELRGTCGALALTGGGHLDLAPGAALDDPAAALTAPLVLDLALPATDLDALPRALLGLAHLDGLLGVDVHVRGSVRHPEPTATLALTGGSLVTADGQRLDDLDARVQVATTRVAIDHVTASRGRGPLRLGGTFDAPGPLWQSWREGSLDLTVRGEDVLLHRRAGVKVRADLDLVVKGPIADATIAGTVLLHDSKALARVPLLDFNHTGGRAATAGIVVPGIDLGPGIAAHFDVRIATSEPFQVTNNVVDGRFTVELALRGPLSQPLLEGTVTGPETQLILPGMRMRAATLLVEFQRSNPRFPVVTATARGRRHGFDVQAVVRGRYDRPQILLSSDPPLPPEDLVVLVTTGARPDALRSTTGVSTVLGAYLAQELADWIFGSESTEAKQSFLDRFTIETGSEMSPTGTENIIVEFRVLDDVFLQGERDVYDDLNMGVVYRLRFR